MRSPDGLASGGALVRSLQGDERKRVQPGGITLAGARQVDDGAGGDLGRRIIRGAQLQRSAYRRKGDGHVLDRQRIKDGSFEIRGQRHSKWLLRACLTLLKSTLSDWEWRVGHLDD